MITFLEYINEAKELTRPLAYLFHAGYGFMTIRLLSTMTDYETCVSHCGTSRNTPNLIDTLDVFCVDGSKYEELLKKCGFVEYKRFSNSDTPAISSEKNSIEEIKTALQVHHKDALLNKDIIKWKPKDEYAIGKYLYSFAKQEKYKNEFKRKITFKNG